MLVTEFEQIVRSLVLLLRDGSAKQGVISGLERVENALKPFGQQTIAQFADFLSIAAEYQRTGVVAATRTSRKAKPVDLERVKERAQVVLSHCESAMSGFVSEEGIEKLSAELNKESAAFLKALAQELNIGNSKITKGKAIEEIISLIRGRLRTHIQARAINS